MEIERTYYTHEVDCKKDNYRKGPSGGLQVCADCSGVFDFEGKGVATTDKRFDEGHAERKAAVEADSRGENL